jgi:hypothetical protein
VGDRNYVALRKDPENVRVSVLELAYGISEMVANVILEL